MAKTEKRIEDYLPLYIGAEAKMPGHIVVISHALLADEYAMKHYGIKPLLKRVADMTREDAIEYATCYGVKNVSDGCVVEVFVNKAGFDQISIVSPNGSSAVSLFPTGNYGNSPESFR